MTEPTLSDEQIASVTVTDAGCAQLKVFGCVVDSAYGEAGRERMAIKRLSIVEAAHAIVSAHSAAAVPVATWVKVDHGHGHVWPRADSVRARCGGPSICKLCALDAASKAIYPSPAPSEPKLSQVIGDALNPKQRIDADVAKAIAKWDASQIKQPGWHHVQQAFIDGAREARSNPDATEHDFGLASDGYTKRVFEQVDPVSEAALRTESWAAPSEPINAAAQEAVPADARPANPSHTCAVAPSSLEQIVESVRPRVIAGRYRCDLPECATPASCETWRHCRANGRGAAPFEPINAAALPKSVRVKPDRFEIKMRDGSRVTLWRPQDEEFGAAAPSEPAAVEPRLVIEKFFDVPEAGMEPFFRKHIDTLADRHPSGIVKQLAQQLRLAWAAQSSPAAQVREPLRVMKQCPRHQGMTFTIKAVSPPAVMYCPNCEAEAAAPSQPQKE